MARHQSAIDHFYGVARVVTAQERMAVSRSDQRETGRQQITVSGFFDLDRAALIQTLRKGGSETFRHMLDDNNSGGIGGHGLENDSQGFGAAGRGADSNDRFG